MKVMAWAKQSDDLNKADFIQAVSSFTLSPGPSLPWQAPHVVLKINTRIIMNTNTNHNMNCKSGSKWGECVVLFSPQFSGQIDFVAIIIAAAQVDDDQVRNVEVEA